MKNKAAEKRRQQKQARRKAERRGLKPQQAPTPKLARQALPGFEHYTDAEHAFWTAHGINFMASDYAQGLWTPVFPGIYQGEQPTLEAIVAEVTRRYKHGTEWDVKHKAEIAWALQSKPTAHTFKFECERRLVALDPGCHVFDVVREPRNGQVWQFFDWVKGEIEKTPIGSNR